MSGLSSKAQALVDAMQFADEPSAADFDRIHAAIAARIAVGAAVGAVVLLCADAAASTVAAPVGNGVVGGAMSGVAVVPSAQAVAVAVVPSAQAVAVAVAGAGAGAVVAPAASGAGVWGITSTAAIAAKVAAWVVAVGLTTGAVGITAKHMVDSRPSSRTPSPSVVESLSPNAARDDVRPSAGMATSAIRAGSTPPMEPRVLPTPQSLPDVELARPVHEPSVRATEVPAIPPRPAAAHVEESEPPGYTPALDAELALIRRARTALNDGRAEEALAALDEHARRFPKGVLAEDRAAQRVLALCALARLDAAREEGLRFVSSHPRSPHVAAIRSSCAFVAAQGN
jgi:hypothetical protein